MQAERSSQKWGTNMISSKSSRWRTRQGGSRRVWGGVGEEEERERRNTTFDRLHLLFEKVVPGKIETCKRCRENNNVNDNICLGFAIAIPTLYHHCRYRPPTPSGATAY